MSDRQSHQFKKHESPAEARGEDDSDDFFIVFVIATVGSMIALCCGITFALAV